MVDFPSSSNTWGAIVDKPQLPEGFSTADIAGHMNDAAAFMERSDLEQSLNAWNYDQGFIDIFWDKTKVSSSNNVTISTQSSGGSGEFELSTVNGSTADRLNDDGSTSDYPKNGIRINPNRDLIGVKTKISANASGFTTAYLYRVSDGSLIKSKDISNKAAGDIITFNVSLSKNTDYNLVMDAGGGNFTQGYYSSIDTGSSTDIDIVDSASGATGTEFDMFNFTQVTALIKASSGSLTHTRKDLGFTPSKIVFSPEYSLNGQSLTATVRDNSGNSINLSSDDFGTEKSVSFNDGNIQLEWQLSGNGSKTPKIQKTKLLGVQ